MRPSVALDEELGADGREPAKAADTAVLSELGHAAPAGPQRSSFSTWEARTYRLPNVLADSRARSDIVPPSSYAASTHDIRDDTAELGDLAINSDDGNLSAVSHYEALHRPAPVHARPFSGRSQRLRMHTTPFDRAQESELSMREQPASSPSGYAAHPDLVAQRSLLDQAPLLAPGAGAPQHTYGSFVELPRPFSDTENQHLVPGDTALETVSAQWNSLRSQMHAMAHAARAPHDLGTLMRKASELSWTGVQRMGAAPLRQLPAVVLGVLLNVLDGVSYGMIMFPTSLPVFADFGGDGVSMFFVTCIIAQLVYTLGGSIFKGGNGSMMIEVVPFYHILVQVIVGTLGTDQPRAVVATTMVAFALATLLTGLTFLLLGMLRLGMLISYFPRHILVGCIGGVGVFLIETGVSVAAHLGEQGGFRYSRRTWALLTADVQVLAQWTLPLALAILLHWITSRIHHPLVFPLFFLAVPVVFYLIALFIGRLDWPTLRAQGWVFEVGSAVNAPFYHYLSYFDLRETSWAALWATVPTQLALVFFGILHVPLNVPALGVSVSEDHVDTDRELIAHGLSNVAASLVGTVPNYLCYVNSVLFYRVGGGSRLSGLMLAGATALVMLQGPGLIGYLPVVVVSALIFVLGIDLVREALYDTIGRVNRLEYVTIAVIVVVMTWSDFVIGSLVGMVLACLFFVMQTSRRNAVRSVFNGHAARSTVRRHAAQRRFLDEAGCQTRIFKLQGSLFFGTINSVEQLIRKMLDLATWRHNPIRFLIMDLTQVSGMDFSAAEAMLRIHRMLRSKGVMLVLCGIKTDSDVATALRRVDLWTDRSMHLEVFASLNEALEWAENEYLRGMYASGLSAGQALGQASLSNSAAVQMPRRKPVLHLDDQTVHSPRYAHLHQAAQAASQAFAARRESSPRRMRPLSQSREPEGGLDEDLARAHALLAATLNPYADGHNLEGVYKLLAPEMKDMALAAGTVLWERGDSPDALYLIESGVLKARYVFPQDNYEVDEAMLAGTIAGELTCLSQQQRNSTVTVEKDAKVWRLGGEALQRIGQQHTQAYTQLIRALLRVTADEHDCLMSYLVSRLS